MDDLIRTEVADELEGADSLLCDCGEYGPPTAWRPGGNRVPIAHHCECRAVMASATVRRGQSMTLHELECSDHGYRERFSG